MISKHFLPVIAIIMVLAMLSPSILAAELSESEILVDMESAHASEYDELVNIADNSTALNYNTWDPAPQGVWIGSTTEESHFQMGVVTSTNSTLTMVWSVRFTSSQIMSGVSEFTIRLPIHVDSSVTSISLYIVSSDIVQSSTLDGATVTYAPGSNQKYIYHRSHLNTSDQSIMDGNDVYVRNNRMYVNIVAPLFPGQIYTFVTTATYAMDANPSWYISPNDIAADAIINSWVGWTIPTGPGTYVRDQQRFDIDWGVSYDMRGGMGNGVTAFTYFLNQGDSLLWCVWAPYAVGLNGYHTLTMPFYTASGEANFSVEVTHRPTGDVVLYRGNTTYDQVILASNAAPENATPGYALPHWDNMFIVNLTSAIGQWVTFYFRTTPLESYSSGGVNVTRYAQLNPEYDFTGSPFPGIFGNNPEKLIGFVPISSYLVCPVQIVTPVLGSYVEPVTPESFSMFEKGWRYALYMIGVKVVQSGAEFFASTFDIRSPGEAVVTVASLMMGGSGVAWWVVSALTDLPSPVDLYREVRGYVNNLMDDVFDALKALGNFLWSIGEYIWDAIEWLAEQIVQYGAVLLGLIIIAVALMLFFYPIKWQLGFWDMVWAMASGDWKGAAKAANGLDRDISKAMRTASKVDRRISRTGKVLAKKWSEFDESVAGPVNKRKPKRW